MRLELKRIRLELDKIEWPQERVHSELEPHERLVLKQSIREIGLLHDIIVCKDPSGKWVGVAGRNRYEALRAIGEKEVEVKYFEPCDEKTMLLVELIENAGRGKISQYEMLRVIAKLNSGYKIPLSQLSQMTGYSVSTPSKLIRVYQKAPPLVLDYIKEGKLTVWHALELLKLPTPRDIYEFTRMAVEYNWSIPELRQAIDRYLENLRLTPEEYIQQYAKPSEVQILTSPPSEPAQEETVSPSEETVLSEQAITTVSPPPPADLSPEADQTETADEAETVSEAHTVLPQNLPRCAICGRPIRGTPITVTLDKQCFKNAILALKKISEASGKPIHRLTLEDILFLDQVFQWANEYLSLQEEVMQELQQEQQQQQLSPGEQQPANQQNTSKNL